MTYIEHNLKELLRDRLPVETDVHYVVDKLLEQCYFETNQRKMGSKFTQNQIYRGISK